MTLYGIIVRGVETTPGTPLEFGAILGPYEDALTAAQKCVAIEDAAVREGRRLSLHVLPVLSGGMSAEDIAQKATA